MTPEEAYTEGYADGYSRSAPNLSIDVPLIEHYREGFEHGIEDRQKDDEEAEL